MPVKTCTDLTRNIDTVLMFINGDWKWLEEKIMQRGNQEYTYLTPKTEGYELRLKLTGDTASFLKNGQLTEIYKFKILKESDITNISTDDWTVFVFYDISSNQIINYVPIKICKNYLVFQFQYVSSTGGEKTWKRL